jgi:transcription antitermination protein NusB
MNHKTRSSAMKRLARLAAVQALYQMALLPRPVELVVSEFRTHPPASLLQESDGETGMADFDDELFGAIVGGAAANAVELDGMVDGAFDAKAAAERLEVLLRVILRAGVYELYHQPATPVGVIINDYVDVTHAFFGAKEPGLVNGILDKLAKKLRTS